jgi:hypothetical protein
MKTDGAVKQIEILRQMTVCRRLQLMSQLSGFVKELSLQGLRRRFPNEPEREIRKRWCRLLWGKQIPTLCKTNKVL